MKKLYESNLLNYIAATSVSAREKARKERYFESKFKKNYENYKLDCLFTKEKPMSYKQFKETYETKKYQEKNLF